MFSTGRARISELERLVATYIAKYESLERAYLALSNRIETTSTAALRADLDNLTGRLETLATSNRKEFGRLHAGRRGEDAAAPVDEEFAATINLQRGFN